MSALREMRKAFFREVVGSGINKPEQFKGAFPLGYELPKEKLATWLNRFQRVGTEFSQTRFVNRFRIGADPEFIFVSKETLERVDAAAIGLQQGPAFGADNNGRLAEIRPHPSRSALEVCASVLATLRWMAVQYPNLNDLMWVAGAFLYKDGLGGHVHFGRKRPTRESEVRALDNINELLMQLNVYPQKECMLRRRGDARGQRYGQPGDIRLQVHGYEYRTFPSWLDSPELAFLTLTISKLAVYDPSLVFPFQSVEELAVQQQRVMNLLLYYQGVDDDARLAVLMCKKGLPRHIGGDFRARWGLMVPLCVERPKVTYIPSSIPPSAEDERELFNNFQAGRTTTWKEPKPTWEPVNPPKDYRMCMANASTIHEKGLGEMILDLCSHESTPVMFHGGDRNPPVHIARRLLNGRSLDKYRGLAKASDMDRNYVYISPEFREGDLARKVKEVLLEVLPVWRVSEVKEGAFETWQGQAKEGKEFAGKALCEIGNKLI